MINLKTKTNNQKNGALSLFENAMFVCFVIVIVLRATFTEAPMSQSSNLQAAINDTVYSLALSGVLIFAALLLFIVRLFNGRFSFKITTAQIGFILLLIATTLASINASNKRAAITSSLTLLTPLLMTIMLSTLLNSQARIKILLIVIVALGLAASWQSADQFFISNEIMLQQYKDDPNSILQPLGIQPGSFNQVLLEHRIYSKDVRASFTTGNSAGSFAILASFAAIALLGELIKTRKSFPASAGNRLLAAMLLAAVLFGLFITRSKGAIGAFLIALVVFILLLRVKRPRLTKNIILAGCVFVVCVSIPLVAWLGLKSGRLPGGNSMLVRWQYWHASAKMFLDHPLSGVGPGNFGILYHQYKSAAAPETVSDPHCFILAILTQYGPLGLIGFLLFILAPLWRTSMDCPDTLDKSSDARFQKLTLVCAIIPVIALLLLRPFIIPPSTASNFDEKMYIIITDYVAPAAAFILGCILMLKALQTEKTQYTRQNTSITTIALFAGLLGVLIHNLVDFAIFEPGILTAFCSILAILVALGSKPTANPKSAPVLLKTIAPVVFLFIGFMYFNYAFLPVVKSTSKITQAKRPIELGQVYLAHNLLDSATADDLLSPDAAAMNGRLYLQRLYYTNQLQIFDDAEQALSIAAQRNSEDYKNFESLAEVYSLRAKLQTEQEDQWLKKALNSAALAIELYPGDSELHFQLAQIAEQLEQKDVAFEHYKKAIQIEEAFREQFHLMYPDREIISRMPEEQYLLAKNRLELLPQANN